MNQRTVLLVEDNPDDELLTLRALKKSEVGGAVEVARDGVEALEILFRRADEGRRPDLVLLDLQLPRLDGHEVLRRLRSDERTALVPVVVLTTSKEERDVITSYRLGANGFVRKPVDFGEFSESVALLGRYWLEISELVPR